MNSTETTHANSVSPISLCYRYKTNDRVLSIFIFKFSVVAFDNTIISKVVFLKVYYLF